MFEYDRERHEIIDPDNGDRLKTTDAHWQATSMSLGIFDSAGNQKFGVTFKSHSIDEPSDGVNYYTTKVLLSAVEYDEGGRSSRVTGPHPQLDRIIEYYRELAASKSPPWPFEFIDARKPPSKPLSQAGLQTAAKAAGWGQPKRSKPSY